MARQYFTKSDVSAALARAVEQAEARGYHRGRDEAARFVEFASGLNGSTHAVVKSLRGGIQLKAIEDDPEPMTPTPAVDEPANDGDLSEVALLALMDVLAEAKLHHPDSDGGEMAAYLAGLIDDPEALQAALGADVQAKAFDESKHPRDDNGRFVSREAIHEAKSDPEKAAQLRERVTDPEQRAKLDAALEGKADLGRTKAGLHREKVAAAKKQKTETINRARELANDISTARRGGEPVSAEHFKELATLLPSLTVQELRSVRGKLAASFFGRRNREDMVTALVRHAKVRAEQMHAEAAADDPLDFGMDAMYGTTGGTGKHGEDELNPWREFDKASDTRHGEAQHGGRIEQRKRVMDAVSDGAKTSHGTPDMGSVLKQAPEPKPVETPAEEMRPAIAAQNAKPTYTTDKPAATVEPKQPHEMTRTEFIATGKHKDLHREAVENAIDAGKQVPPEVLKDYPRLQAEVSARPDRSRTSEADASAARLVDSMKQYGEAGSGSEAEVSKRLNARGEVLRQLKGASEAGGVGARSHSDRIAELIADNKKDIAALEKFKGDNSPKPAPQQPAQPTTPTPKSDTTYQYGPELVTVEPQDVEKHRQRASSVAGSVANSMFNLKTGSPTSSDTPDAIRRRMDMIDGINRAIVAAGGRPHVYDRAYFESQLQNIAPPVGPKMGQFIPSEGGQRAKLFNASTAANDAKPKEQLPEKKKKPLPPLPNAAPKNNAKSSENVSTTVDNVAGNGDTTPVEPQSAAPKRESKVSKAEMQKLASEYAAMPHWKRWELPNSEQAKLMVWSLADELKKGFREYPTMELPSESEIDSLYTDNLDEATKAVSALNKKYRSGYHHSAKIAGVAHQLSQMLLGDSKKGGKS